MKTIEIDEELYRYIASHTHHIGESASDILRRLLDLDYSIESDLVLGKQSQASSKKRELISVRKRGITGEQIAVLRALLGNQKYIGQKRVVNRFLQLLTALYHINKKLFATVAESLQGSSRLYFSTQQETLLRHGNNSNPQKVPDTPYWVITNTNAARKRYIVEKIMLRMGFSAELIQEVCSTIHTRKNAKSYINKNNINKNNITKNNTIKNNSARSNSSIVRP